MPSKRLKDQVCVVGIGCTAFGEHFDSSYEDLVAEAAFAAMGDAGVSKKQIDAAWLGTAFPDAGVYKGRAGMDLAEPLGMFDIPITRVSNYCATAAETVRGAVNSLLAGESNVALAVGVEKLRDRSPQDSIVKMMVEMGHPFYQKGFTAAGTFAMYASRHFQKYGVTREDLAAISVKNHAHACLNPKAHFRREISLEQAMRSPMVADPLTVMDSCPTTDGAAALVLVRTEDVGQFTGTPVYLKGLGLSVSTGWDLPFFDPSYDLLSFQATKVAAGQAYREADIDDPAVQIDLAEVHDCFSIVELLTYEDLGFCRPGEARELVNTGATCRDGSIPVNVSGGLLSCGHPVGATGIRMVYEICEHLRENAGERQIPDARLGLAHNIGGPGAIAAVTILGKEAG